MTSTETCAVDLWILGVTEQFVSLCTHAYLSPLVVLQELHAAHVTYKWQVVVL
jgi:hypothetical protein